MAEPVSGPDVVTVGETMIMLVPEVGTRLADATSFDAYIGGAESNVAISLAQMGVDVRWASVLPDEPLGQRIAAELGSAGVDVASVVWSDAGQAGVYFKDPGDAGTRVYYYRRHSAARLLDESLWSDARLQGARVLHLSGITPALSDSARRAVASAVFDRSSGAGTVSFDINFRPDLWGADEASAILTPLADAADVLFVGLDEAQALWGCEMADSVREILPNAGVVIVKDGAVGAHAYTADEHLFVPSRTVKVVEPVGAGDAFAAGYISGVLDGRTVVDSLRLGHLLAATALGVYGDIAPLPPSEWLQAQLELSDEEWNRESLTTKGGAQ
jgi:2-dehydro-3-deoxygluconokinase